MKTNIEELINEVNILSQIIDAMETHKNKTHYTGIEVLK